jgi:hypothetical protein
VHKGRGETNGFEEDLERTILSSVSSACSIALVAATLGYSIQEDTPQQCRNEWLALAAAAFAVDSDRATNGLLCWSWACLLVRNCHEGLARKMVISRGPLALEGGQRHARPAAFFVSLVPSVSSSGKKTRSAQGTRRDETPDAVLPGFQSHGAEPSSWYGMAAYGAQPRVRRIANRRLRRPCAAMLYQDREGEAPEVSLTPRQSRQVCPCHERNCKTGIDGRHRVFLYHNPQQEGQSGQTGNQEV